MTDGSLNNAEIQRRVRLIRAQVLVVAAGLAYVFAIASLVLGLGGSSRASKKIGDAARSLWSANMSRGAKPADPNSDEVSLHLYPVDAAIVAAEEEQDRTEMLLRMSGFLAWLTVATVANGAAVRMFRSERRSKNHAEPKPAP